MKKVIALFLTLSLIMAVLPLSVFADGVDLPIIFFPDGVEYTWAPDYSTCTADDGENQETVNAVPQVTSATCTAPELTTYTATFTTEGFVEQSKTVETAPANGHKWSINYAWIGTAQVMAYGTCSGCDEVLNETANTVANVVTPATCTEPGQTTYTATFQNEALVSQSKTVEDIEATGHAWGEVTYVWAEDNSTCTATRVCATDANHVETETVNSTSVQNGDNTVFTATFTNEAFVQQTKTVSPEPSFLWGDANDDGVVSNKDIVRLKNYFANFDDETETSTYEIGPGADANGDGVVSNKDIVRLKNYFANYDDETETSTYILGPA